MFYFSKYFCLEIPPEEKHILTLWVPPPLPLNLCLRQAVFLCSLFRVPNTAVLATATPVFSETEQHFPRVQMWEMTFLSIWCLSPVPHLPFLVSLEGKRLVVRKYSWDGASSDRILESLGSFKKSQGPGHALEQLNKNLWRTQASVFF